MKDFLAVALERERGDGPMLLRFRVSNFRSLRHEQELSLVASSLKGSEESVIAVEGFPEGVLRAAAIYGANASGKTNVLRALHFVCFAVEESQVAWKPQMKIPRQPYRLGSDGRAQPSIFEIDLLIDDVRYEYRFAVDAERVLEESLYSYPERRRRLSYRRTGQTFHFGKNLAGPNQLIKEVTRPNSLFLSAAAQNNHEDLLPVYQWFAERVWFEYGQRGEDIDETLEICSDAKRKAELERLLQAADLGLLGIELREREVDKGVRGFLAALNEALPEDAPRPDFPDHLTEMSFLHRCEHEAPVRFSRGDESAGTLAYLGLLGPILSTLENGGVLCVDELDSSLHPSLALEIVRAFNDPMRNPKGAQLIFNTHDTNLLDPEVLRRDQIWFTEKDACGATSLYPLTDFKPRRQENLQRGYLQGRYGAIPFLKLNEVWPDVGERTDGGSAK